MKKILNATQLHYQPAGRVHKILNTPTLNNNLNNIKAHIMPIMEKIKLKNKDKILPSSSILVCMDSSYMDLMKNRLH